MFWILGMLSSQEYQCQTGASTKVQMQIIILQKSIRVGKDGQNAEILRIFVNLPLYLQ